MNNRIATAFLYVPFFKKAGRILPEDFALSQQ